MLMLNELGDYFKDAGDNIDSLTLDEASIHMHMLTKFMREFLSAPENNKFAETYPGETKKINQFLERMVVILTEGQPASYLYDAAIISRKSVEQIHRVVDRFIHESQEDIEQLRARHRDAAERLHRDIGSLTRG